MKAHESRRRDRIVLAGIASLLLLLWSGPGAAQAKDSAAQPQGLGVQEHQVGGVDVFLLEVRRTAGDVLTVKWQYRNNTNERKRLTDERTGWIDPYRLAVDAYVLDDLHRTKYPLAQDEQRNPIAARHGGQNEYFLGAGLFENVPIGR